MGIELAMYAIGAFNLVGLSIALYEELNGNHIGTWS